MNVRTLTHLACLATCFAVATPAAEPACRVACAGAAVELHSPAFVFRLDTSDGLRAMAWQNRLTGQTLDLGRGAEVEFDIGLPGQRLQTPRLRVVKRPAATNSDCGEAVFELESDDPSARVAVTYRWDADQPVLHKSVTITNRSEQTWNRLLNIRLGRYETSGVRLADRPASGPHCIPVPREFPQADSAQVERGFPVYAADEFFLALAHPAGVAEAADGKISLRQYPGVRLESGAALQCLETVYGVAPAGQARAAFLRHITSRMRRVVRGHDRPYAIFEPFGARPGGSFDETEQFVLDSIAKVAEGQRQTGLRFDAYSVDFWVDYRGTLKECDPQRFPHGLTRIQQELDKLGTPLGLWIDSSWEAWSVGGNPQVQGCLNVDPQQPDTVNQVSWGRKSFCRATEPIRALYVDAFRYHIRENGVRSLKFDNLANVCQNPNHQHLPGVYSTEPIMDAVIEFLRALDRESPDVFLMLYWGYRSPWWLLDGDTLFDSGLNIEAASPSTLPAPHARDSVTQKLDQAQWHASDVPALGKDSLGVWFSDWGWNSQIGRERWQEGFLMDLCRGSLLAQPWSDTPWLTPPERQQMAEFIALLRARPECFRNPRFVAGNPQRDEPYGYCCTDGQRAIIALYNCSWRDNTLTLQLKPEWGLPAGQAWDIYRWYPEPAQLRGAEPAFHETAEMALRPFEVVLLELVPTGGKPSLDRAFDQRPLPASFSVPSRDLKITARHVQDEPAGGEAEKWTVLKPAQVVSTGGATLTLQPDGSVLAGGKIASPDTYTVTTDTTLAGITAIRLEALLDDTLPDRGPGRAVNGNFAVTGIRLRACPQGKPDQAITVTLQNPQADFAQESYGGWPVTAALDGDPKTGWSIDPEEGQPHEAVFEMERPVGFEGGATLTVELDLGDREHSLGRFRLSVSTAKPIPAPQRRGRRLVVQGAAPPSPDGGLLVVTVEMSRNGQPEELHNVGRHLSAEGQLDGKPIVWQPVLGTATYPSCWQAWRLSLRPSTKPLAFELVIAPSVGASVDLRCVAHFIPAPGCQSEKKLDLQLGVDRTQPRQVQVDPIQSLGDVAQPAAQLLRQLCSDDDVVALEAFLVDHGQNPTRTDGRRQSCLSQPEAINRLEVTGLPGTFSPWQPVEYLRAGRCLDPTTDWLMRSQFMPIPELSLTELTGRGLLPGQAAAFVAAIGKLDQQMTTGQVWQWITRNLLRPEHPPEVHEYLHGAVFADWDPADGPAPAWFPEDPESSNIAWLMRQAGTPSYQDLHAWSVTQPQAFWATMVARLDVQFRQPFVTAIDLADGPEYPRWLVGARLNVVDSCFQAPDDSRAVVYQAEDGTLESMSVAELRSLVARVANGLEDLGIKAGDRVAIDMPMTVESVAIYLGAVAAGCPVVTVADSFAPAEIAVRLQIGEARCLFTQDFALRRGKQLPLYEKICAADAPRAIVVPCGRTVACELRDGDLAWQDFLSHRTSFQPVSRDPADFTTILFSSGTTGAPKAIPWDQTTPIKSAIDAHLHHDSHPGDVLCWPTNMGWMMGPWLVYAALLNKATLALFYGAPTSREFGQFVQDAGVTMLGLVPSLVSAWRSTGCLAGLDWSGIRAFSSTGECSNPQDMLFLMSRAGYKPVIEYCGGTEIGGGYMTGTVVQPAAPATFSTPALGSDLVILNEQGQPADRGELFLIPPALGLSRELLNGDQHAVYYAGTPAGPQGQLLRRHGDQMQRFANGYYRAHGRVDDTMNLGGIKVSSLQIEELAGQVAGVRETAAIAVSPPTGGPSMLILYAVPSGETELNAAELRSAMQEAVRTKLNPLFKVYDVVITPALPRTASNKVMRRSLRAEYERRMAPPPSGVLANPRQEKPV